MFESSFFQYWPQDGFAQFYFFEYLEGGLPTGNELYINENPGFAFLCQSEPLLSVEEQNLASVKLYPNPTSDRFYIDSKTDLSTSKLALFSLNGVSRDIKLSPDGSIDISNKASGVYIFLIENQGLLQNFRIVKL